MAQTVGSSPARLRDVDRLDELLGDLVVAASVDAAATTCAVPTLPAASERRVLVSRATHQRA